MRDYLDISARKIVFCHNKLSEIDIGREGHSARVDAEDSSLRFLVGQWELDLPIYTTRSNQGRIESFDSVGCHHDFNVSATVES